VNANATIVTSTARPVAITVTSRAIARENLRVRRTSQDSAVVADEQVTRYAPVRSTRSDCGPSTTARRNLHAGRCGEKIITVPGSGYKTNGTAAHERGEDRAHAGVATRGMTESPLAAASHSATGTTAHSANAGDVHARRKEIPPKLT
jgi:hypothetical protein